MPLNTIEYDWKEDIGLVLFEIYCITEIYKE